MARSPTLGRSVNSLPYWHWPVIEAHELCVPDVIEEDFFCISTDTFETAATPTRRERVERSPNLAWSELRKLDLAVDKIRQEREAARLDSMRRSPLRTNRVAQFRAGCEAMVGPDCAFVVALVKGRYKLVAGCYPSHPRVTAVGVTHDGKVIRVTGSGKKFELIAAAVPALHGES